MKVVHILNTGAYSGAENVAIQIINNLNKRSDIENIYMSKDGTIRGVLEENGIEFYSVEKVTRKAIRKMISDLKPDILHCHDYTTSILATLSTGKPIVSHLHNNSPWLKRPGIYSWAYLFSCVRYVEILLVSESIKEEYVFSKLVNKKMQIIGNPINVETIVSGGNAFQVEKEYDICFLGRLSPPKSPFLFLKIVERLKSKFPELKVCMIGDGELKNDIEQSIRAMNLETTVELLGFKNNPYPYLKHSKFLLGTSTWEGYGLFAVEALALGKPVICTAVGGLPMIVNDSCGVVCETEDELYGACIKMLEEPEFYGKKASGAKRRVEEIVNMDAYMKNIIKAYEKCMQ